MQAIVYIRVLPHKGHLSALSEVQTVPVGLRGTKGRNHTQYSISRPILIFSLKQSTSVRGSGE